jgi:hypothetical protein
MCLPAHMFASFLHLSSGISEILTEGVPHEFDELASRVHNRNTVTDLPSVKLDHQSATFV